MKITIPTPAHWQDFELLCRDLFAAHWGDPDAKCHGRTGQPQAGVDVYGRRDGEWHGVQCKLRDQHYGARLSAKELKAEVTRARGFKPGLATFVLATTAPKDVALQEAARELTARGPFRVEVCFWEDLVEMLHEHGDVLDRHYAWDRPNDAHKRELLNYLDDVKKRLGGIPLAAIDGDKWCPTLDAVYTALDVEQWLLGASEALPRMRAMGGEDSVNLEERESAGEEIDRAPSRAHVVDYIRARAEHLRARAEAERKVLPSAAARRERRLSSVEFLAAHDRAVLLGPAGSGKSAFASFVALCLANARLGSAGALTQLAGGPTTLDADGLRADDVWPHGALIPLYVELRRFVSDRAAFPRPEETPHAGHLLDHLGGPGAKVRVPASFLPHLRQELLGPASVARPGLGAGRGVLLLLDGLDETATADREQLRRAILAFVQAYPRVRVLVTSRPYAYRSDAEWRLPDFVDASLARLEPRAIERFVRGWYASLARANMLGTHDPGVRPQHLLDRIATDRHLGPLAERPLLLTLLTSLHASHKLGDGGRAAVYHASVDLLFDRWNEVRDGERVDHFHQLVGLDKGVMLDVLRRVAWRIHSEQGRGAGDGAALIPFTMLWEELGSARTRAGLAQSRIDERKALTYLDERAGLLLAEGKETFRFPHRSFQEFLAAQATGKDLKFPAQLATAMRADPELWREVMIYSVLLKNTESPALVWSLVGKLVQRDPPGPAARQPEDRDWRIAIACGVALTESDGLRQMVREALRGDPDDDVAQIAGRVIRWLVACLERGVLNAAARIEGGEALGLLGDPRIGHCSANFLPIAPGSKVALGRYLVTVSEYAEFVDRGGYWRDGYWQPDGGLVVRMKEGWTEPVDFARQLEHPNRPVVGVSWYEASAYCRWRSQVSGEVVRLPTHEERRLAGAPCGRCWPWGNEPEPTAEIANFAGYVGRPTPVGCYPLGVGAGGHLDLVGNAWEWTDAWRGKAGVDGASIWGGSWLNGEGNLRTDILLDGGAFDRGDNLGFRVVAPASQ